MVFQKRPISSQESEDTKLQLFLQRMRAFVEKKHDHARATKLSGFVAMAGIGFVLLLVVAAFGFVQGISINVPQVIVQNVANVFGTPLKTDADGRTNVLLLGIGGGTHDGANLTDTILVASFNSEAKQVALLSIPRDLYVRMPKLGGMKINAVYDTALRQADRVLARGEEYTEEEKQYAMMTLRDVVSDVIGTDIQYYTKIDFDGFKEMVDLVGGIEVDVPYNFLDRQYPNESYGYTTFYLKKGLQTLDGETALKYARSRYSTSDFDRSARQQVLIKALIDKAMQRDMLMNPNQLRRMYLSLSSNISTDMDWREILKAAEFAVSMDRETGVSSLVLHDDPTRPGGLLYAPNRAFFAGASVLLPQGAAPANPSNYIQIQKLIALYFENPVFFSRPPKMLVLNATDVSGRRVSGVATQARELLQKNGVMTAQVGDAPRGYVADETTMFFFAQEQKSLYEHSLALFLPGEMLVHGGGAQANPLLATAQAAMLDGMLDSVSSDYDVVLVLGNDYAQFLK